MVCGSLDPSTEPHDRKIQRRPAPGNTTANNLSAPSSWPHTHLARLGAAWPDRPQVGISLTAPPWGWPSLSMPSAVLRRPCSMLQLELCPVTLAKPETRSGATWGAGGGSPRHSSPREEEETIPNKAQWDRIT